MSWPHPVHVLPPVLQLLTVAHWSLHLQVSAKPGECSILLLLLLVVKVLLLVVVLRAAWQRGWQSLGPLAVQLRQHLAAEMHCHDLWVASAAAAAPVNMSWAVPHHLETQAALAAAAAAAAAASLAKHTAAVPVPVRHAGCVPQQQCCCL
jgi:hypothetical protein